MCQQFNLSLAALQQLRRLFLREKFRGCLFRVSAFVPIPVVWCDCNRHRFTLSFVVCVSDSPCGTDRTIDENRPGKFDCFPGLKDLASCGDL